MLGFEPILNNSGPAQTPPTINQAVTWLASQPHVSIEDVLGCLSQVMFRNPEGGLIVSDEDENGVRFYRKMTLTEVLAEMRASPPIKMMAVRNRKLSDLLKKSGVTKQLPFRMLGQDGELHMLNGSF
jgi:hypothetical protein